MFRRITSFLFCTLLLSAWQCEDSEPEPVPDCLQVVVVGPDCHQGSGQSGYYLLLEQPIPESIPWVNPTTGVTEHLIDAINVPEAYQQAGATFFCTVRKATSAELANQGVRTAICPQVAQLTYLQNVGSVVCTSR
jgi:hypothetical protein